MTISSLPHRTFIDLRYSDTDRQGHINNAVFATLIESGRVHFLVDETKAMPPDGADFVVAEITIKYLRELHFPSRVEIATGIGKIGNSSFQVVAEIIANDEIVSSSAAIIVMMDRQTRRSKPLDDNTRAYFEQFVIAKS